MGDKGLAQEGKTGKWNHQPPEKLQGAISLSEARRSSSLRYPGGRAQYRPVFDEFSADCKNGMRGPGEKITSSISFFSLS